MSKLEKLFWEIYTLLTLPFVHLRFIYRTEIRPRFVPHYWCKFYDGQDKTEKEGWYILDRNDKMIPWVHFGKRAMICLYPSMITPIEKN